MGDPGWRWWFRTRCKQIAEVEKVDGVLQVTLCRRWRWHGGECG